MFVFGQIKINYYKVEDSEINMNPRYAALQNGSKTRSISPSVQDLSSSENFGMHVFNRNTMQKMLRQEVYQNVVNAMNGQERIKPEFADLIAMAMKDWAVKLGATHYSHWFHPLTGSTAEKHDSFIEWSSLDQVIEKFDGKQLIQGEPDASSFPSGGLRSTYEARGYTGWDPTSPAFLWSGGDGVTLCIPSLFSSWTGDVLDTKTPLLRSDRKISDAVIRLLELTGVPATYVNSTLGWEQEYFVIDRSWRDLRPDLVMAGRTVFGCPSSKGQELQDHYLASVKDRMLSYMRDYEQQAIKLGIPVKTRHNEVAPSQYEVAPVYEKSSVAVDHNIILMELMQQTAVKHNLSCLLHEKPFHGINGSGKHCNWSLATDTGINLLDPTDTPENNIHFLVLLTAILNAIYDHSALLRASIASAANDFRLGGHEAPPAIISVYLGQALEDLLVNIETNGTHKPITNNINFDLGAVVLSRDTTDRNRSSPMAFTGNKFEFRAVGSSANPAFPITVLNTIVAESVNLIVDEIQELLKNKTGNKKAIFEAASIVIRKYLKRSKDIRFGGDNYSEQWKKEAKKRNLPIVEKSVDAFEVLKKKSTIDVFKGILNKQELFSRYDVLVEMYSHKINIEINLMVDLFRTHILPACICHQKELANSIGQCTEVLGNGKKLTKQRAILANLCEQIEKAITAADDLEESRQAAASISDLEEKGKAYCYKVLPKGELLRGIVDYLEQHVDDSLWPLAKYREMLFL